MLKPPYFGKCSSCNKLRGVHHNLSVGYGAYAIFCSSCTAELEVQKAEEEVLNSFKEIIYSYRELMKLSNYPSFEPVQKAFFDGKLIDALSAKGAFIYSFINPSQEVLANPFYQKILIQYEGPINTGLKVLKELPNMNRENSLVIQHKIYRILDDIYKSLSAINITTQDERIFNECANLLDYEQTYIDSCVKK
ncbi:hypothetical protein [Kurthia sp. Dielmo]|uniref:hypothetical protein n=1 Tax=Kurthia sp. Dielmo TaxID=1033738 RepID=UPI00112476C5|nr:hypothetical protein [Kurthia sp. Dielmo]